MNVESPLNKTQLEILNMFSRELAEEDLVEVKRIFIKYLSEKAKKLADQVWEEKGWTNEDMERLSRQHMRSSSEQKP